MDIINIRSAINLEFDPDGLPQKNEIDEAINECVRNINGRTPAIKALITITGDTSGDESAWNVDNIDIKVDAIDVNVDDMGRFIEGFTFNSTEYYLTIPQSIIALKAVYIDDIEQINKPYEVMKNTELGTEDFFYLLYGTRITSDRGYYTQYGRKVYFNKDLSTETSVLKLSVEMKYNELDGDTLNLPDYCYQYLISNCVKILGSRSKNKISEMAHSRHIVEADRFFKVIINNQVSIEQPAELDIW